MSCIFVAIKIQCYKRYNIRDFYCVIFGPPKRTYWMRVLKEGKKVGNNGVCTSVGQLYLIFFLIVG